VLEAAMLEQYVAQYNFRGCCLRAPWIMEKDDFRWHLSFGRNVFGAPRWYELVSEVEAEQFEQTNTIPLMLDADQPPLKRNFVHVDDLVNAILVALDCPKANQQTFNICMDEPVDYGEVAQYLAHTRGLPSVKIVTNFHSTWSDNSKAKFLLGWRPSYDFRRLVDAPWNYERSLGEPRVVWYPG
jgi:UDP-glucose 4-epimerase